MFLRLFENFVKFPFYSLSLRQGFPLGGRWTKQSFGRMRGATCFLSGSFQSRVATCSSASRSSAPRFPLRGKWRAAPIEVYLKFCLTLRLPLASIKFCFTSSLPLGGGKVDKAKLWTNEGRNLFSIRIFSIKWRNLFALPFLSPSGLTLPNCRSMQSRQVKWRRSRR